MGGNINMRLNYFKVTRLIGVLFATLFILAACGDSTSPGDSPAMPTLPTPTPCATTSANPAQVVVVGAPGNGPNTAANSTNPADWPQLRYAGSVMPNTPPKSFRLKLDQAQTQQFNSAK